MDIFPLHHHPVYTLGGTITFSKTIAHMIHRTIDPPPYDPQTKIGIPTHTT